MSALPTWFFTRRRIIDFGRVGTASCC